jgi:hypothetical protein
MVWFVVRLPDGLIVSHVPVCAAALAVNGVALLAVTLMLCAAGAEPPAVALKLNCAGVTVRPVPPVLLSTKDTATVTVTPPPVIVIAPLWVPAARPAGFTLTEIVRGVTRFPEGLIDSQVLPADAVAVNGVAVLAVTLTLCEGGAEPPTFALKVKDVGLT